jgi:hypothetical protein
VVKNTVVMGDICVDVVGGLVLSRGLVMLVPLGFVSGDLEGESIMSYTTGVGSFSCTTGWFVSLTGIFLVLVIFLVPVLVIF